MYIATTRLNIMYGVSLISRVMISPKVSHWKARKRILKSISGTRNYGICYSRSNNFKIIGYTNSDCEECIDDRKSTLGYDFHFGSGVVSWASKKQSIFTLSSAKVEYVVDTSAAHQTI